MQIETTVTPARKATRFIYGFNLFFWLLVSMVAPIFTFSMTGGAKGLHWYLMTLLPTFIFGICVAIRLFHVATGRVTLSSPPLFGLAYAVRLLGIIGMYMLPLVYLGVGLAYLYSKMAPAEAGFGSGAMVSIASLMYVGLLSFAVVGPLLFEVGRILGFDRIIHTAAASSS